jgi:hypothetical protein
MDIGHGVIVQPSPYGKIWKEILGGIVRIIVFTYFICLPQSFINDVDEHNDSNTNIVKMSQPSDFADIAVTAVPAYP